jgi:WD40 repeat protein
VFTANVVDCTVRAWNVHTGECVRTFDNTPTIINCMASLPAELPTIIIGSVNGTVCTLAPLALTNACVPTVLGRHATVVDNVFVCASKALVVSQSHNDQVCVYDMNKSCLLYTVHNAHRTRWPHTTHPQLQWHARTTINSCASPMIRMKYTRAMWTTARMYDR